MRHMVSRTRSVMKESKMISGTGGGAPGMQSMDAMRQLQQRMFSRADGNGSGGLDASEFGAIMKNGPAADKGPQGIGMEDLFKKMDGDGNGELSQAEMEAAQQQIMAGFKSTLQAFGDDGSGSTGSRVTKDPLDTLLRAIGNGGGGDGAGQGASEADDLVAQLERLASKVSSTYSVAAFGTSSGLMAKA